jgi:hypothetical protein
VWSGSVVSSLPVPQAAAAYIKRDVGGVQTYPTASETVYRNTNGTGGQTTTYGYSWFGSTHQVEKTTVTRPAATAGQNGSGSADADLVVNNSDGRPVWVKDAAGFIHYTEYDFATGGVVKTIADVNTATTSDFTGLPGGWSTPSGGGKHLKTVYEVDGLGRPTKETSPDGDVTYTVYNDVAHEVRVYPGWNTSTDTPTGPTIVMRADWPKGYHETLTMSATPTVSSGRPTGAESVSGVQSLRREVLNEAGQVVFSDEYFDLTGTSYSATSVTLGTSGRITTGPRSRTTSRGG